MKIWMIVGFLCLLPSLGRAELLSGRTDVNRLYCGQWDIGGHVNQPSGYLLEISKNGGTAYFSQRTSGYSTDDIFFPRQEMIYQRSSPYSDFQIFDEIYRGATFLYIPNSMLSDPGSSGIVTLEEFSAANAKVFFSCKGNP